MTERRKDPYRVRRSSSSEFSRVTAMLKSDVEALTERVNVLEKELNIIKRKLKRTKSDEE